MWDQGNHNDSRCRRGFACAKDASTAQVSTSCYQGKGKSYSRGEKVPLWELHQRSENMQQCQVWPISDQKVRQNTGILYILTYKCAARHSGVQFFDIGTLKSCPRPSVFYDFDFKMCFSPQRAIFAHLNFKKCSEPLSFLAFSLQNVLLATTAYNFSTSQLKKVVRTRATGGWVRPLRLKVPLKVPLKGTLRSIKGLVSPPPKP